MLQPAKKTVLIVSPCPTHPTTAGNRRRVFEVCKKFQSSGFYVHFLWFGIDFGGMIHPNDMQQMRDEWDLVHVVNAETALNVGAIDQSSLDVDRFWSDQIHYAIDWLQRQFDYDVLWVNYVFYSKAFECLADTKSIGVLDTHDALSLRPTAPLPRPALCVERSGELEAFSRADVILSIQDEERAYFQNDCPKPVLALSHMVRPNMVRQECRGTNTLESEPVRIGLIGSNYPASVKATQLFLASLGKHTRIDEFNFKLCLAGPQCAALQIPIPLVPHTTVLGTVDDLASFYSQIDLLVNPVEEGTGLKIKTVEALSFDCPVIGTKEAFKGIQTPEVWHALSTAEQCSGAVMELLAKPAQLSPLHKACSKIFAVYMEKVEKEWGAVLSFVSTLRAKKRDVGRYTGAGDFQAFEKVYIYGAGSGMFALLSELSDDEKRKIEAFIDQAKAGQIHTGIPIVHLKNVSLNPSESRKTAVIITVLSPEWKSIYDDLSKAGFVSILPAHQYLLQNRLVS